VRACTICSRARPTAGLALAERGLGIARIDGEEQVAARDELPRLHRQAGDDAGAVGADLDQFARRLHDAGARHHRDVVGRRGGGRVGGLRGFAVGLRGCDGVSREAERADREEGQDVAGQA
jgi:hypothetical protein